MIPHIKAEGVSSWCQAHVPLLLGTWQAETSDKEVMRDTAPSNSSTSKHIDNVDKRIDRGGSSQFRVHGEGLNSTTGKMAEGREELE